MEENGCVTMDMNLMGTVVWVLMGILIPAWGLCTTQVCFHWFSQLQEGQAAAVIQEMHFWIHS